MTHVYLVVAILLIHSDLHAQETWSLTTSDFATRPVSVTSIDSGGVEIVGPEGVNTEVSFDKLLVLERANPSSLPPAKWRVFLTGDEQVTGDIIEMKGEDLRFRSAALGEIVLPLKRVAALAKSGVELGEIPQNRTEDQITLANGDVVRGIIADFSPATLSVQRSDGQSTAVPVETISRIDLANTGAMHDTAAKTFRVTLSDGTRVDAPAVVLDGTRLRTEVFSRKQSIPVLAVKSIEQLNGPVVWLSSLAPQEDVQVPFYGDRPRKSQRNATVLGQPIRFASQTFLHGVGVHSLSRLTYAIDPSFRTFRTQYAMDGELPWADVTVRIKLDGNVVHEQQHFKAGKLAAPVSFDVTNGKTITLEVDYGDNYDVQDRLNWIEPAFVR
jgi:hypothetical protein